MGHAPRHRSENRDVVRRQVHHLAHDDGGDDREQGAGHLGGKTPHRDDDHDDGERDQGGGALHMTERTQRVDELDHGSAARRGHAEHLRQLAHGDLDADAGQEAEQDGARQEVRQEPEPHDPREHQEHTGEQGRGPGELHVVRRPRNRDTGQAGGQDGGGRGVGADHQVPRGAEHGEEQHGQEHRVEAGDRRHSGDLGVAEHFGDGDRREREPGDRLQPEPRPLNRQQPAEQRDRHATRPAALTGADASGPGHHAPPRPSHPRRTSARTGT